MAKSVVFGGCIALIGCHWGLRVKPNTQSLGEGTTASVVTSITMVIIVDALFAVAFRNPAPSSAPIPKPLAVPAHEPPIVEAKGLWSVFGKGTEAFAVHQDLEFSVQRGEMLSLVGGSGTGKTVLLRQILGLARPTRGSVTVLGRPASEMGREGAASRVGMLFQHGALFSAFNVLDNVAFALREQGTLPDELVRAAAL
eukprot:gene30110-37272_t